MIRNFQLAHGEKLEKQNLEKMKNDDLAKEIYIVDKILRTFKVKITRINEVVSEHCESKPKECAAAVDAVDDDIAAAENKEVVVAAVDAADDDTAALMKESTGVKGNSVAGSEGGVCQTTKR